MESFWFVANITSPISHILSENHHETLQLFLTISSHLSPVVLGLPCLKKHNPSVDWSTASIINWSKHCLAHCLRSVFPACHLSPQEPLEETDLNDDLLRVP